MEGILLRFLCVCVLLICGTLVLVDGASLAEESGESESKESHEIGVMKNKKHDRFFKSLPPTERTWILRLVLQLEAEKVKGAFPGRMEGEREEREERGGGAVKPVDEFSLIPPQLFDVMLNGDVSEKFQKDLIKWLRKDYGIQDEEFAKYTTRTDQICHNGKCWDLGDIGSECCPF